MSSLNNSAIDELLQEKDILSSPDRLQSIWSQYTNTYYIDKDRDTFRKSPWNDRQHHKSYLSRSFRQQ